MHCARVIFLVQPLIAKQALPWFGGSAAIWATCLLFFQTALLSLKRQVMLHTALLAGAALTMPILVSDVWWPTGTEEPFSRILLLLSATIGLPYLLLSAPTPPVPAGCSPCRTSLCGCVFASLPPGPRKVGVIGLGAGALAAYARAGDDWVFYEISPAVVRAALQEFTFLPQFPGRYQVVVGDGRLALEREAPRQYDVLAMDAFAGDSIPTHLITREAMAAYLKHLKPDGVLVFQATNRFVNLMPVLHNLAHTFGMQAVLISDSPPATDGPGYWLSSTDQVIVTRNQALLQSPALREAAQALQADPGLPVFTDDYVNLVRILKW